MVEEILENLIAQFSDPLTFYRELIQNALDAGASMVEVSVTRRDDPPGVIIAVTDWGEGMNRHTITHELTRLFASSKEDDFTKIGKFGIGFVSVFAIQPELVVVDTGRDGESWRIVFDGSPNYQCLRLENPFEGTRIRIYKALPTTDFDDFVTRSVASVRYWCRYSDVPIQFNGQRINEELTLPASLVVRHQQPGTEVVVGLSPTTPEPFGLYNRGLTLMEGQRTFRPGLSFRIKSRYLEHTLTRDNVLMDQNFTKAIRIMDQVAKEQFPQAFMARVKTHIESGDDPALEALFTEAIPFLTSWRRSLPKALLDVPLFPALHGPPLSINQVRQAAGQERNLYLEDRPNHVTEVLWQVEVPVLRARAGEGPVADALAAITGYVPQRASQVVAAPVPAPASELQADLGRLTPMVSALLHDGRVGLRDMVLCDFEYEGSAVAGMPCLIQHDVTEPIRLHRRAAWWRWLAGSRLLLNRAHPLVQQVMEHSRQAPLLGAYAIAKIVMLQGPMPAGLEARWLARCLASRPRLEEGWLVALSRRWLTTPKRA
ncbi:MAG TPA: ATP-binding protein [Candidatus Xenobia bacterium]|jgi:hypothetical protein